LALKVWTVVLLLVYAPTRDAIVMTVATTWPWIVVLAALAAGPAFAWFRLVKMRARRKRLQRSEWMLDEGDRDEIPGYVRQWPR
jgi:hypothetical protein